MCDMKNFLKMHNVITNVITLKFHDRDSICKIARVPNHIALKIYKISMKYNTFAFL